MSPDLLPEPAIVLDGEGTIHHAGDRPLVTASVGIAPFAAGSTDSEPLLAAADAALHEVKRAGGNACASRASE